MNKNSNEINIILKLKYFTLGYIAYKLFLFVISFVNLFTESAVISNKSFLIYIFAILYIGIIANLFYRKSLITKLHKILKSKRFDLLILIIFGYIIAYTYNTLWTKYYTMLLDMISLLEITYILFIPVIIILSSETHLLINNHSNKKDISSSFMSDKEGTSNTDDGFQFIEHAENFAEKVYDHKSSESLVFGIDAPWGTGKTTFVNLCKEYWFNNYAKDIIVYSFEPLRYEQNDNLLEHFIDGLIKEIKHHIFIPEIKSLITRYSRILQNTDPNVALFGLSFNMNFSNDSIDSILNKLENILIGIDKKIIIIVDDLDRLEFDCIKDVLNVIKKSFSLPNISYVLCYDTENISSLESFNADTDKIIEFFEKYINVKTSIFIDKKLILDYFTKSSETIIDSNALVNKRLTSKAIEGIKDIFDSDNFHEYLPLVGDARKIKRIINTIIMLDIEETDFENCDFNKKDLINLLLIYINYPNLFRKVFYCETQGNNGFFSVVYDSESKEYINSQQYTDYIITLSVNKQFILNQIFDAKNIGINSLSNKDEDNNKINSYACFNGNNWNTGGRNLEDYLNLIVKMKKPIKTDQYTFHTNKIKQFFEGEKIENIINTQEFIDESSHKSFWNIFVNMNNHRLSDEKFNEIIDYLVSNLDNYSMVNNESNMVEFRNTVVLYILRLLDDYGWKNSPNDNNNYNEKVIKIAHRIFGENEFMHKGIIDSICKEKCGVLSLNDLLHFRLYCNMNRHGDFFNLTRGLYYNKHDLDTQSDLINEMREISQYVFSKFKKHYISPKINIFNEIDKLEWKDVCGTFNNPNIDTPTKNKYVGVIKYTLKSFILYQLNTTQNNGGIGCGYYDISGNEDRHQIYQEMNSYLYDFCFNPEESGKNHLHFLDYLLIKLNRPWHDNDQLIKKEFISKIECEELKQYWRKNKQVLITLQSNNLNRELVNHKYMVKYDTLEKVFVILDEFCSSSNSGDV